MRNVKQGSVLISEPFLGDPNFERSVVLICEHETTQGTFGLVLNQTSNLLLADVLEENIYPDVPLQVGGPVQHNTLHYLHRRPDLIDGGVEIMDGVTWGGNFSQVKELLNNGVLSPNDIRRLLSCSCHELYLEKKLTYPRTQLKQSQKFLIHCVNGRMMLHDKHIHELFQPLNL